MADILVIDDEVAMRESLALGLAKLGHRAVVVASAAEGIRKFKESPMRVVITDMLMPDQDGFETIRHFRKHHPHVQLIAISGGGKMEPGVYLNMAEQIGASFTLTKPFSLDELRLVIETALGV